MADGDMQGEGVGYWDLDRLVTDLAAARSRWRQEQQHHAEYGAEGFPSRANLVKITGALCGALFPLRLGPSFVRLHNEDAYVAETLQTVLSRLYGQIRLELIYAMKDDPIAAVDAAAARIIGEFAHSLPALRTLLDSDVEAAFLGDPAARSVDEVLICYPSMLAIIHHRLAHRLYELGAPLVARIISEIAHSHPGIDIHPGARIGHGLFIDHRSASNVHQEHTGLHLRQRLLADQLPAVRREGRREYHDVGGDEQFFEARLLRVHSWHRRWVKE